MAEPPATMRPGNADPVELEQFGELEPVSALWSGLAEQAGNLFATWEWASIWWRHFGGGRALRGTVVRDRGQRATVILPLYVATRSPLVVLRFLGHGAGDWLGPIHSPEHGDLARAGLLATLGCSSDWDLLLGEHLRVGGEWIESVGASTVRREAFPMLPLEGRTWDGLLAERSANFREQARRRERRLGRSHTLAYRLAKDPARLDGDLDVLFGLHRARWGDSSGALSGAAEAFHREFARTALERGWLRLWIMTLDDVPAAAWYGFRYGDVEWYYQSGWDPARRRDAPGFVLLCHTIRAAIEEGACAYWFLRGDEGYKSRFAEHDPGVETVMIGRGLRGQAAVAAGKRIDRMPSWMQRWARRASG